MISPRTHGILDYIVGLALIAAPWLFGFATMDGVETWLPVLIGMAVIGYSLCTNYALGLVKSMPLGAHLAIDVILGLFLAVSPWLFGFASLVWAPHLIVGLLMVGSGLMTRRITGDVPEQERPERERTRESHAHR